MESLFNWAKLLEPGLRKDFFATFSERPPVAPLLFRKVQMTKRTEEFLGEAGGFSDFEEWDGSIKYESGQQGYYKSYTAVTFAKGFKVERELIEDDLYNQIGSRNRALAVSAYRTMEKRCARVFNYASATTYIAGGDTKALCAADHPTPLSASTQSNYNTLTLTPGNIETVRLAMRNFQDNRGNRIMCNPDLILIPPALEEKAWEYLNADKKVEISGVAQQNHPNFHRGRYNYIVWDELTDTNNWFMIDSVLMKQFLLDMDRVPLEFFNDTQFDTQVARFAARFRKTVGFTDWRWIYGNFPA